MGAEGTSRDRGKKCVPGRLPRREMAMPGSWKAIGGTLVLTGAALLAGCGGEDEDGLDTQLRSASSVGLVSGYVYERESGMPIANAEVRIASGTTARTRADGWFELSAPAGRARVTVTSEDHLMTARVVAVGGTDLAVAFRRLRRAEPQEGGEGGGRVVARAAVLDVPAGAYRQGAKVAVTTVSRAQVSVLPASPQFLDNKGTPRRALSAVAVESSKPPAAPMRLRVQVPETSAGADHLAYSGDAEG